MKREDATEEAAAHLFRAECEESLRVSPY
jgi:hypothetical protein